MTQRRSSASGNSKLPEELQELLNISSNDLSSGEVKEFKQFLHEFKIVLQFGDSHWEEPLLCNIASIPGTQHRYANLLEGLPVSYTHLDVYKRQVLNDVQFSISANY